MKLQVFATAMRLHCWWTLESLSRRTLTIVYLVSLTSIQLLSAGEDAIGEFLVQAFVNAVLFNFIYELKMFGVYLISLNLTWDLNYFCYS